MNIENFRRAAVNLNQLLDEEDKIDLSLPKEKMEKELKEASECLEDGDEVEQNTIDVLLEMECDVPAKLKIVKSMEKKPKEEKKMKTTKPTKKAKPAKKEKKESGPTSKSIILESLKKKEKPETIVKTLQKKFPEQYAANDDGHRRAINRVKLIARLKAGNAI